MKTGQMVVITSYLYKGAKAMITGFEHINVKDNKIVINKKAQGCDRVELQSLSFNKAPALITDHKLYFAVKDFDLVTNNQSKLDEKIFHIAQDYLGVTTLETRNQDCLDHHDCSVWGIRHALEAAYNLGRKGK